MRPPSAAALGAAVERLEAAYETARQGLADEIQRSSVLPASTTAEVMRDASGRYILLDALTALVQARAVLAQIDP